MGHSDDSRKSAARTAVSPLNGAVIVPGNPGNSGGKKGRNGRLKVLKQIADNERESAADRIRAVDTLGKYGGIQKIEHTGADDGPIQVNVVELRERIAGRLARLASSN
jgi:hypothetical protein